MTGVSTESSILFVIVQIIVVIGVLISSLFLFRVYPIIKKYLVYSPKSYSYFNIAWILISISTFGFFVSHLFEFYELHFLYKFGELITSLFYLSSFLLLFLGFRNFSSSLGIIKGYLKKPFGDYKIILFLTQSHLNIPKMMNDVINQISVDGRKIILGLGQTSCDAIPKDNYEYCISLAGTRFGAKEKIITINENNPTEFNLHLSDLITKIGQPNSIIGDFLDTHLRILTPEIFNTFWSHLVFNIRNSKNNGVFFISKDMHSQENIAFLRRYSDVVMEIETTPEKDDQIRIKISNMVDNIMTGWIKIK